MVEIYNQMRLSMVFMFQKGYAHCILTFAYFYSLIHFINSNHFSDACHFSTSSCFKFWWIFPGTRTFYARTMDQTWRIKYAHWKFHWTKLLLLVSKNLLKSFVLIFVLIEGDASNCPHAGQKIHPFVSLPFGYGRRMCIGRRFAENELHILVAKVIWEMSSLSIQSLNKNSSSFFYYYYYFSLSCITVLPKV